MRDNGGMGSHGEIASRSKLRRLLGPGVMTAAMLAVVMLVAIRSAKWGDIDSLETLLGVEEATYFAAFMWLAICGPGAASMDRLLVNAAGHSEKST